MKELLKLAFDLLFRAETPDKQRLPVLVVDDELPAGELLEAHVKYRKRECDVATSLAEARRFLRQKRYSVAFLDVKMPGEMTGIEFGKEIRKDWPETRIVFVTGHADFFESAKRDARMVVILKGFTNGALRQAVEEELDLDEPAPEKSRKVFLVSQGYFWLAVAFGYGLHAGWWMKLIKLAGALL